MQHNNELDDLIIRLKNVIVGTCNTIGCKNCNLKWDGGCSATELEAQIINIEMEGLCSKQQQ